MQQKKLQVTWEQLYTGLKRLSAVNNKGFQNYHGKCLRMTTAHNDKFACTLLVYSLEPADKVDPLGDLLAILNSDILGCIRDVCVSPFLSAKR